MAKKFYSLGLLVQIILLLIPFVNWIVELVVRWDNFLSKKDDMTALIVALLFTFFGAFLGFVDLIYFIITRKLILL